METICSPYLGLRLSEAELLLRKSGIPYRTTISAPGWKKDPIVGSLRVIQVRKEPDNGLELICCTVADPFSGRENPNGLPC